MSDMAGIRSPINIWQKQHSLTHTHTHTPCMSVNTCQGLADKTFRKCTWPTNNLARLKEKTDYILSPKRRPWLVVFPRHPSAAAPKVLPTAPQIYCLLLKPCSASCFTSSLSFKSSPESKSKRHHRLTAADCFHLCQYKMARAVTDKMDAPLQSGNRPGGPWRLWTKLAACTPVTEKNIVFFNYRQSWYSDIYI